MLPDIDSLRCFEAAARHLNFRAAAGEVGLSPAAFSERIRRLEDRLEARLFERTTRRVSTTSAGERLLVHARRCLDEARRCREAVAEEGHLPPYGLTIGTRFELGMSWLVPALDGLRATRPERRLHLSFGNSSDLLDRLRRGQIDAVISSIRLTRAGLEYAPLHPEEYVFVGCPRLLAERPLERGEQAGAHTLVDIGPPLPLFRYFLDAQMEHEDWPFGGVEYMGTIAAIRHRVLRGVGVAVLPRYFIRDDIEAGRFEILRPDVPLRTDSFRLIWRSGAARGPELHTLAEELRALPLR